jgi:AraC-like DNA-binding protein
VPRTWRVLIFKSDRVTAGVFPSEGDPPPQQTFTFPRTVASIPSGDHRIVATPATVLMHNGFAPPLESSVWYALSDEVLFELISSVDRELSPARPFRFAEAAPPARTLIEERLLLTAIQSGAIVNQLEIEQRIIAILRTVIRAAYAYKGPRGLTPREIEGVEAVRDWIARNPADNPSLAELGIRAGMSRTQLCRLFPRRTGLGLTRYSHVLRGCLAIDIMTRDVVPLAEIAARLGYSSHGHFTRTFKAIFGETPSDVRRRFAIAQYTYGYLQERSQCGGGDPSLCTHKQ